MDVSSGKKVSLMDHMKSSSGRNTLIVVVAILVVAAVLYYIMQVYWVDKATKDNDCGRAVWAERGKWIITGLIVVAAFVVAMFMHSASEKKSRRAVRMNA